MTRRAASSKRASGTSTGDKQGKPIESKPYIFKELHPGKLTPFGISIIRHDVKYEETTLFEGYPVKRPWYPLSSDIYPEVIPSIGDQYPYPIKCLMLYMGTPVYALPGGDKLIPILMDVEKLPPFISIDITTGETSLYADYIFPDLSYLERWEFHGSHLSFAHKIQPIRQPVIAPIPETVKVFGQEMPLSLEVVLLAIAEKLGLPGFDKDGFAPGMDLTHPDHFYLKMVANVAAGDKSGEAVPDAELELFLKARRHLPKSVFDPERWKAACGEAWWRKTVTFALGFGHWAYGASEIVIDGQRIPPDPRRAKGVHLNAAMRVDPLLKNTPLTDPVGASVVFYETRVKLERVG